MKTNGFTFIELVVTSTIIAIIGSMLFSMLNQTNKSITRFNNYLDIDYQACIMANQLEKDITGIFIPPFYIKDKKGKQENIKKVFWSENLKEGDLKLFTFITNNPYQVYEQTKPRIARVIYTLEKNKNNNSFNLYRKESEELDISNKAKKYELADNIKEFKIIFKQFSQEEKTKKRELKTFKEWKKDTKDMLIPQFVEIKTVFWDKQQKKHKEFSFYFEIYSSNIKKEKSPEKKPIGKSKGKKEISKKENNKRPPTQRPSKPRPTKTPPVSIQSSIKTTLSDIDRRRILIQSYQQNKKSKKGNQ